MSYDVKLYKKGPRSGLLKKQNLEKLNPKFGYKINKLDEQDKVVSFDVDYKNDFEKFLPKNTWELYYQAEEGYYGTGISYSANEKQLKKFIDLVSDLSLILNLKIEDPQIANKIFEPEEYRNSAFLKAKRTFDRMNNFLRSPQFLNKLGLTPLMRFFYVLLITSIDPKTSKRVLLQLKDGKIFAGKFDNITRKDKLEELLKKDVFGLTGSEKYTLVDIKKRNHAFEKDGHKLSRVSIILEVPYFDPTKRKLKQEVGWKYLRP